MELTEKYSLLGVNFSELSGDNVVTIDELLSGAFTNGDRLQLPKNDGSSAYDIVEWKDGQWVRLGTSTGVNPTVERGTGFWIVSQSASATAPVSIQLKGAIKLGEELVQQAGQGYRITSTGFPIEMPVNGEAFSWENLNDGDLLQVPKGDSAYDILEWTNGKWSRLGTNVVSDKMIPASTAVWLVSTNPDAKVRVNLK